MGICVNDAPQCSINTDDSHSCLIDTMTHLLLPQQHASLVITKKILGLLLGETILNHMSSICEQYP